MSASRGDRFVPPGSGRAQTRNGRARRVCRSGFGVALLLLTGAGGVGAAERSGPLLIGALTESWGPTPSMFGFRAGLQELGYRENEHYFLGVRFTQGDPAALLAAARELVQQRVDLVFVAEANSAKAAQAATDRIPIVFAGVGDPQGLGLIRTFARPGGNVTGVTDLDLELTPKRLEVFREVVPGLKRVLLVYDPTTAYAVAEAKAVRDAARRLGLALLEKAVRAQDEARAALAQAQKGEVDGIVSPRFLSHNIPGFILEATSQRAIPAMFNSTFFVEQGGLASYGPNLYESGRQAARLVDKILKGANPAAIPVEVNQKIEFGINLKTARALGLTIAPEILYRADRIFR